MSAQSMPAARSLPRFGGFSAGMIGLELRRMVRNRRTVVFTLVMPAVFFLLFGTGSSSRTERVGGGNVTGYILVSMAVYGRCWRRPAAVRWCRSSGRRAGAGSCG